MERSVWIQPGTLTGKTCVLVGASGGIGAACAKVMAIAGAQLLLAGHDPARLKSVVAHLHEGGVEPERLDTVSIDLRTSTSSAALLRRCVERYGGPPEVVLNVAGIGKLGPFHNMTPEELTAQIDVNFTGAVHLLRTFAQPLVQSRGIFVQILSGLAHVPRHKCAVYAATQHALKGLMGSLRLEYGGSARYATVTVAGAGVDTRFWDRADPRVPREGMLPPERVAEAVMAVLLAPDGMLMDDIRVRTP